MEAVWAEGPCRNLIAGAGFPLLFVPDHATAEELRTRLLGSTADSDADAGADGVSEVDDHILRPAR